MHSFTLKVRHFLMMIISESYEHFKMLCTVSFDHDDSERSQTEFKIQIWTHSLETWTLTQITVVTVVCKSLSLKATVGEL